MTLEIIIVVENTFTLNALFSVLAVLVDLFSVLLAVHIEFLHIQTQVVLVVAFIQ